MAAGGRKNHLSVMMVHAPVALVQTAKKDPGSGMKMCDPKTGELVKQVYVNEATGEQFTKGDLGRAVEVSKGAFRLVPEGALAAIEGSIESIELEATRPLADLPLSRIKDSHYVQAEGGSIKALALIYAGLKNTGRFALAKAVVGTKERLVALVPEDEDLVALTLRFADQVKQPDEDTRAVVEQTADLSPLEVTHAEQLMAALNDDGDFLSDARDEAGAKRAEVIAAVLANEELPTVGAPEVTATAPVDLEAMITQSLRELNVPPKKRARKAVTA